jgi:hypothetical protein
MQLKTTTKLTKASIILFCAFVLINAFEIVLGFLKYKILNQKVMSNLDLKIYNYSLEIGSFVRPAHGILNLVSLALAINWFIMVYRLMRVLDPGFKANKIMPYLFWMIPLYSAFYVYAAQRKIIRVGKKHIRLAKRMHISNLGMFVFYCLIWAANIFGFVVVIRFPNDFGLNNGYNVFLSFCGFFVSIFTIIFYKNYLKMECQLVLDYSSSPELNESGLIDG